MSNKILQFQVDLGRLAEYMIDVAADWVFDPDSEMYKKYRTLRKEEFIELMRKDNDEAKMTKKPLIPIGLAAVERRYDLVALVMSYDNEIVLAEDVFGYLGINLTRDQIVDGILHFLRHPNG